MKKTFIFYTDREDYTEEMSLEEKGLLLQTILNYQKGKDLGNIDIIKFVWSRIKKQLDFDNNKRQEEVKKRSKAGIEGNKKRWGKNRKPSQVIASATNSSQLIADNDNDNDNVYDNIIKQDSNIYTKEIIDISSAFINLNKDKPQIKYQLEKQGYENYIEKQNKVLEKIIRIDKIGIEVIKQCLRFIVNDNFWRDQILSIAKLREKNKDGVPYIVVIMGNLKKSKTKYEPIKIK